MRPGQRQAQRGQSRQSRRVWGRSQPMGLPTRPRSHLLQPLDLPTHAEGIHSGSFHCEWMQMPISTKPNPDAVRDSGSPIRPPLKASRRGTCIVPPGLAPKRHEPAAPQRQGRPTAPPPFLALRFRKGSSYLDLAIGLDSISLEWDQSRHDAELIFSSAAWNFDPLG